MQTLLCFSHLTWNFVYQRPQHLMSRFAKKYRLFYFEEAKQGMATNYQAIEESGLTIVQLYINHADGEFTEQCKRLINQVVNDYKIEEYICWYYTPMSYKYTDHLAPTLIVYDCMDELSAFKFAPAELVKLEDKLLCAADVVFTGGNTLYLAKKDRHHNIHAFPSSIDKQHFMQARMPISEPDDQRVIPYPRLGFYGVIDERFDIDLLAQVSRARSEWQFIIIGPIVKISAEELPLAQNIHYLGSKTYSELPAYVGHWNIALILFALNESTRFISPTKTPEYLAAGLAVLSTAITDVVDTYGKADLVYIVEDSQTFICSAEKELQKKSKIEWLRRVDEFLAGDSWDNTFEAMQDIIDKIKN